MTGLVLNASDCTTMEQVRAGVGRLDKAVVALLAERMTYMDAASRIKPTRGAVRDEVRKAQVLENVRASASELGLPDGLAPALWELLIEASIRYELQRFDTLRGD